MPQSEHPDQAPAFTATVRTSQCGHTVWGKRFSDSYPMLTPQFLDDYINMYIYIYIYVNIYL